MKASRWMNIGTMGKLTLAAAVPAGRRDCLVGTSTEAVLRDRLLN